MISIVYQTSFNFYDLNTEFVPRTKIIWFKLFRMFIFLSSLKEAADQRQHFYDLYGIYSLYGHYKLNYNLVGLSRAAGIVSWLASFLLVCPGSVCDRYHSTLAWSLSLPNLSAKVKKGIICLCKKWKGSQNWDTGHWFQEHPLLGISLSQL